MYVLYFNSIGYFKFTDIQKHQLSERSGRQTVSVFFIIYYYDVRHLYTNVYENNHENALLNKKYIIFVFKLPMTQSKLRCNVCVG